MSALRSKPGRARQSPTWGWLRRQLGRLYLRLTGWRVAGLPPKQDRYVAIAAPHTSYWDFVHMMAYGFATDQHISYLMKDTMFRGPLKPVLLGLGGIPVNRASPGGLVGDVVKAFEEHEQLIVVIAPEGTRGRREHWKSGFYRMAERAGVPIALGFLDYGRREVGYGEALWPSGDLRADMEIIRLFYADKQGLHAQLQTPARVEEGD